MSEKIKLSQEILSSLFELGESGEDEFSKLSTKFQDLFNFLCEIYVTVDSNFLVSITDKGGKIIYANSTFCDVSEYSLEELVGKKHNIIKSNFHEPIFFKNMWDTISAGQVWKGKVCNRKKSGDSYWVQSIVTPVRNHKNLIVKYLSIRNLIDA